MKTKFVTKFLSLFLLMGLLVGSVPAFAGTSPMLDFNDFGNFAYRELCHPENSAIVYRVIAPTTGDYMVVAEGCGDEIRLGMQDNGKKIIVFDVAGDSILKRVHLQAGTEYKFVLRTVERHKVVALFSLYEVE